MTKTAMRDEAFAGHIPFVSTGAYPPRAGNAVRPLVDGVPAFRRICQAVEAAQHSVWVTVAFLHPDFEMPDGRGSLFDVLDRAAARGVDVRAIFWRVNPESQRVERETFPGHPHQHEDLIARSSRFSVRWDRGQKGYCQHQKSWVIDAGHSTETAFVGGINLGPEYVVSPSHEMIVGQDQYHDVYVEVTGPAATDVHHNFVQRWNGASERDAPHGVFGPGGDLDFPETASPVCGTAEVQIQRTVRAGHYHDGRPTPGGAAFDIASGDLSIYDQYLAAIGAARRTIYIENQGFATPEIVQALKQALERGVDVVVLVPGDGSEDLRASRRSPARKPFFDLLGSLGEHDGFALVGIAGRNDAGGRSTVYIHAKIMLIDDNWATIGSCNIATRSFFGDTELNASYWDPQGVRALRCELLAEHLGLDTADLDDREALALYRRVARANAVLRRDGDANWQGLAFDIDPAAYGEPV